MIPVPPSSQPSRNSLILMLSLLALLYLALVVSPVTRLPLFQWDESRLSVNALEMVENNRLIVTHFDGKPEMWNTKPPMLIWAMALSLKVFGLNHVAARLPATLAGCLTVLLVAWFTARRLSNAWVGFLAGIVLLSSVGFVGVHAAIAADYDVPLALCLTVLAGAYFQFVETGKRRYFAVVAVALACAVLTKSVAALMPLPALLLYAIWRRRLWTVLKDPFVYLAIAGAVLAVAAYYLARESQNPGYLAMVGRNELWGRYLEVNEQHHGAASLYLRNLWAPIREWTLHQSDARFVPWLPLAAIGALLTFFGRDEGRRRLALFATMWFGVLLAVISAAKTKIFWYDVPLFPAGAVLVALALEEIAERTRRLWQPWSPAMRVTAIAVLLAAPLALTFYRLVKIKPDRWEQFVYLKQLQQDRPELVNLQVAPKTASTALRFYVKAATMTAAAEGPAGARVDPEPAFVVCDPKQLEELSTTRSVEVLHQANPPCATVRFGPPGTGTAGAGP